MEKLGEEDRIEGGGDKDEEERGERERTVQAGTRYNLHCHILNHIF